jgi:FG-GAP-like repeat
VRSWALDYENSPRSGRSRLVSVRECTDAAHTNCLPATQFAYSNGAAPEFTMASGFAASPLANKSITAGNGWHGTLTGDFNGDGKTDILFWNTNTWENEIYFSTGNGGFARQWAFNLTGSVDRFFSQDGCYSSQVMDFNGDGRSDILRIVKPSCSTGQPSKVYLAGVGGQFTTVDVSSAIDFTVREQDVRYENTYCADPMRASAASANQLEVGPEIAVATGKLRSKGASRLQLERSQQALRTFLNQGTQPQSSSVARAGSESEPSATPLFGGNCYLIRYTQGNRFFVLDMNGDGLPDIVTTQFPGYTWNSGHGAEPDNALRCSQPWLFNEPAPTNCTRVFLAQGNGAFAEDRPNSHPNAQETLYTHTPNIRPGQNPYWRRSAEADFDGDGLMDISSHYSGFWRNRGDGSFELGTSSEAGANCTVPIDFNGDQRADCLSPESSAANQRLTVAASHNSAAVARFNLTGANDALYSTANNQQTAGVLVEDLDGDGRQDIIRWSTTTNSNGVYLSNGDGSFRGRIGAGLDVLPSPLMSVDGNRSFISGDFLGNGSLQLLKLTDHPDGSDGGTRNKLLHLAGDRTPIDHLVRVTTGTGVVFEVGAREPITTSAAYSSDRGDSTHAAVSPLVDLQPPSYVITSSSKTTPGFAAVETRYSYHGLKAERNGRGMLGFRETRQQTKAPNGDDLTVVTRNFLTHPYIGVASVTETFRGPLSLSGAQRLSRTTHSYCDKTSGNAAIGISTGGIAPAPCSTNAKIQRPYLYQSLEEGWDLNNPSLALPTVLTTNTYNGWGDPTEIVVRTSGTGPAGLEVFDKVVSNVYTDPITDTERWVLGRLQRAEVRQTAPNSLASLATSKGSNPRADQRDGNGPAPNQPPPPPPTLSPATLSAILSLLLED